MGGTSSTYTVLLGLVKSALASGYNSLYRIGYNGIVLEIRRGTRSRCQIVLGANTRPTSKNSTWYPRSVPNDEMKRDLRFSYLFRDLGVRRVVDSATIEKLHINRRNNRPFCFYNNLNDST